MIKPVMVENEDMKLIVSDLELTIGEESTEDKRDALWSSLAKGNIATTLAVGVGFGLTGSGLLAYSFTKLLGGVIVTGATVVIDHYRQRAYDAEFEALNGELKIPIIEPRVPLSRHMCDIPCETIYPYQYPASKVKEPNPREIRIPSMGRDFAIGESVPLYLL